MPVTLLIVAMLLIGRVALARRPTMIAWRTLLATLGAAALLDLARAIGLASGGGLTVIPLMLPVTILLMAAYLAMPRAVLVVRASPDDFAKALARSARMVRLKVEGGPHQYVIPKIEPSATVAVSTLASRVHHVVFSKSFEGRKGKLLRAVLAKQFGRLVPILIRVRS